MLEIDQLSAGYGGQLAVVGAGLRVEAGSVCLVLGVNGAGKSTLLQTVAGLHPAAEGRVRLDGDDVTGLGAHRLVRRGVVLVPEGRQVFAPLTVEENLRLGGHIRSTVEVEEGVARAYDTFPILRDRRRGAAGLLSGGEQQMLALARGLMSDPSYMLLDEPTMGLAPVVTKIVMDSIATIAGDGVGVLMVEQNVRAALAVADQVAVMARGQISPLESTGGPDAQARALEALLGQ